MSSVGCLSSARISGVMVKGSFQRRSTAMSRERNMPSPLSKMGSSAPWEAVNP